MIYIYKTTDTSLQLLSQIKAHEGPVIKISFSHPRFGGILASAGFDGKVNIWKETNNIYENIYEYKETEPSSMNYITFSMHNNDLLLASGSADGNIIIFEYKNDNFITEKIYAHDFGVNSISFSEIIPTEFISCGNDGTIKIWSLNNTTYKWENIIKFEDFDCNINDVTFKTGSHDECFASCGEDGIVYLFWKVGDEWKKKEIASFDKSIAQLSWNDNGEVLVAALNDGDVQLIDKSCLILDI